MSAALIAGCGVKVQETQPASAPLEHGTKTRIVVDAGLGAEERHANRLAFHLENALRETARFEVMTTADAPGPQADSSEWIVQVTLERAKVPGDVGEYFGIRTKLALAVDIIRPGGDTHAVLGMDSKAGHRLGVMSSERAMQKASEAVARYLVSGEA